MIPVFEPDYGEKEIAAVVAALRQGEISGSFGESIPRFEKAFADYCQCKHGIAVSSGTAALQLAVAALGFERGSEILVSSSTNIATALAVIHNDCVPIPVDSEDVTWNLDLDLIEGLITPRTRAIIPVHIYGHPVDMDRLCEIVKKHNLIVIEDCAESHGATCRGRMTGSFGRMGCFSFYANKIITTGEGGMVITNDDSLSERLRLLRNMGFTRPRFRHELAGFNFRMTGFQAAMGGAQCANIEQIISKKRRVAQNYHRLLAAIPGLQLPTELDWARNVYWMYAFVLKPEFGMNRNELMTHLETEGIETRTFFCPMNKQPCIQKLPGFRPAECPVAENLWENGLYLPSSTRLTEEQISQVASSISRAASRGGTQNGVQCASY